MPSDQRQSEGFSVPAETGQASDERAGNSRNVDQVFSMFKGYLEQKLEDKEKQIVQKSRMDKELQLKYKGVRAERWIRLHPW